MKNRKKRKFTKPCWLLAGLVAAIAIFILMLLYRPADLPQSEIVPQKEISQYITHVLSKELYNGVQQCRPFDLTIPQDKTKDIIALSRWPRELNNISFSAPKVFFEPGNIVLMTTAVLRNTKFAVTAAVRPVIDQNGLLYLKVARVKIGAVNITPAAKIIAPRMYAQRLARTNPKDLRAKTAGALLNDEPFEPVFEIENKKVRIEKIIVEKKKLTLRLTPVVN